jgi:hypothetical protein
VQLATAPSSVTLTVASNRDGERKGQRCMSWVTRFFNAQHNKVLQLLGGALEVV